MKRITIVLASALMLLSLKTFAQNERMLLLESFTNTGCGPCAMYNPGMDALIANNPDKVVAIKYHVNWPSATDPMYLHNTSENGARTSYYGVNSVPHVVVDGNRFSGNSGNITQSIIDQLHTISSPMQLRLSWEMNDDQSVITVHVMGQASTAVQGNLRLYVGVIEKEIHFNSAPGPNGERDFYQVMKKLLPGSSGQSIGALEEGGYFAYSFSWEVANFYDINQIDAIAWVQNTTTKEVIQACASSETLEPFFANEAMVSDISNVKETNCSGVAEPVVTLANYGSNTLTSAELGVFVNDELLKTITWTGSLSTAEATSVELGEVSFPVEETNLLEVRIVTVNGGSDEAPDNDIASFEIKGARENVGTTIKLTIRTDNNPQETTWKVTDLATGNVVLEGGPYELANHAYNETLVIEASSCYDFTIYDAGGDGFTSSGLYGMKSNGTTLFSGKEFGYSESHEFNYSVTVGTEEDVIASTHVFPNPTTGMVNIISEGEWPVIIYNMAGQRVYEGICNGSLQIDMKVYGAGIYAIQVGNETQRIVVR